MKNYISLSKKYKTGTYYVSKEEVKAYVQARMPATLAAISAVLQEFQKRCPVEIKKYIDFGAGPGTGFLAMSAIFPELEQALLIEKNRVMIEEGKKLLKGDQRVSWQNAHMEKPLIDKSDLALFSYSLGECANDIRSQALLNAWQVSSYLILIEPGTPQGFSNIIQARNDLISLGGNVIAPCPHNLRCPLEGGLFDSKKDWCHFSVRLERSREHQREKGGTQPWEDEKFSYCIVSHEKIPGVKQRLISFPKKQSGHILLKLCEQNGINKRIFSKKDGDLYRNLKKAEWGDGFFL